MTGFNYNSFKQALKNAQEENHRVLLFDIEKVKAFVEKALTLFLESSTNKTLANYPSVGI